ncbi:DNA polymerase [Ordospora pajunii]|uniref:DNA polymerase n=1 Tax=Ordospora pajunii TaxID=3039483 RepID=UPI00295275F3|nr:DNA polymerase [Ordospora pajunii]KAH9411430.1 DNA polymerase [Ordospora pajunii]
MDFDQQVLRALCARPVPKTDIQIFREAKVSNFYIKRNEKYDYVKHRLECMRPYFLELLQIKQFESVNHISASSFCTYGMIVNPTGIKLDASNICVASNIDGSNDVVVRLNLEHLCRYSVFPGQIIAVKGKNIGGDEIIVERLDCVPVVDVNTADAGSLGNASNNPRIIAFQGPYYSELSECGVDVFERVLAMEADILILIGPFVKPLQELGGESPFGVLSDVFMPKVRRWLRQHLWRKVVLVPSIGDPTCLNVYPQEAIDTEEERMYCVSNPCEIFVNRCLVAISSLDMPLEICSEECFYNSGDADATDVCGELLFKGDRMDRLAHHLVFQRSFVPVFPSRSAISYSSPEGLMMGMAPDVYLVVSRLKGFCRRAGPSLVVNLGFVARGGKACVIKPGTGGEANAEFVDLCAEEASGVSDK